MKRTFYSLLMGATSSVVAIQSEDKVLSIVMVIINSLILLSNCFLDIYRKWRDRDSDLKEKDKNGKNS